jgi:GT2 family glycosyltransferase
VLPEPSLFFGFEELDFCLKVKEVGFTLLVSTDLFLKSRTKYNRLSYQSPLYTLKTHQGLSRQFYSVRNLLWILKWHKLYRAFSYQLLKALLKCGYGFRFGIRYGAKNFRMMITGVWVGIKE